MNNSVRITVATVCYNSSSTIRSTVESVLKQTYPNVEYVVVDGASTDGTNEILRQYQGNLILVSEKDNGVYDAMNKALSIATGDYIIFMGADDLFYDDMVLSRVAGKLKNPNAVYYGNVKRVRRLDIYAGKFSKWDWGYKNPCHQSIFYPIGIYKSNCYNLRYRLVADWVYNLNLLQHNTMFIYLDEIISLYNDIDGLSSTNNDEQFLADKRHLITDAVGILPYVYGILHKILKKII